MLDEKQKSESARIIKQLINENKIRMKLYPVSELWIGVTNPGDEEKVKAFLKSLLHP